jgi:Fic family protein
MRKFDYGKIKEIKIDIEVLELISTIREFKGKEHSFEKYKKLNLTKLIQMAKIQSIESSNRIEGIRTTEKRIADIFLEKTTPKNRDEEEIMGYRDVLNSIHENYEFLPIASNYFLQMHRDLYKFFGGNFGGKYKSSQNYIQETDINGNKEIRFTPTPPFLTPDAVDSICNEYEKAIKEDFIEPLLIIPIFILDFLCIHPFNDGNGRMSRLLTLLLLYKNDFFIGKYISIEKMIEKTKDNYYSSLKNSSTNWHENKNDVMPFVKYFLQIIIACYRDFEEKVLIIEDRELNKTKQVESLINSHYGKLTKNEIAKMIPDVSVKLIERTLNNLLKENKIKKLGSGKNTFYVKV